MSEKYENNTYLFANNLNNQLQLFDVVILHELPKEEDLKQHLINLEERKKRDHRRLGKELELFMISEYGPGSCCKETLFTIPILSLLDIVK